MNQSNAILLEESLDEEIITLVKETEEKVEPRISVEEKYFHAADLWNIHRQRRMFSLKKDIFIN